ncbi:hypothetical protein R1sor_010156 [Riccia sorocarpa]|uniref:FAR1-related sequence 11-like HTH-like domain-containing protein n=1 Tax=Riccia sorocarpa TaxID=122646 RepID=A0ABD3I156_9MARC
MIRIVCELNDCSEEWIVKLHVRDHNHSLLSGVEISLLAAFRYISPEDGERIKLLKRAGLKVSDILNVLRLEKAEVLSFNSRDVRNFLSKESQYLLSRWCRDVCTTVAKRSTPRPLSEEEIWKQAFLSKLRNIAQCGASLPSLRAQLEEDLGSMYEHAFGTPAEEERKDFPPVRGKRLLLSPSNLPLGCDSPTGDGVLSEKTNIEEPPSVGVKGPLVCITKGRPKSCRLKSAIENLKPKGRVCRACGHVANHDKRNCPSVHSQKE